MDQLSKRIRYYRKKCDLTQEELANLLNVSVQYVSKYENGLFPSTATFLDMCYCLHISPDELAGTKELNKNIPQSIYDRMAKLSWDQLIELLEYTKYLKQKY